MEENLICSNCFKDEGLKLTAVKIGKLNGDICPNCKFSDGFKLTKELSRFLCYMFFVRGTIQKLKYGGAPLIQVNNQHFGDDKILLPKLEEDIKLLEDVAEIGLYFYGPRMWMLGEIEPLKSLQDDNKKETIIDEIIDKYPHRELSTDQYFYRLRKDPGNPNNISEYDSPPSNLSGGGRFDSLDFPVLYGSQDLEICLHECRVTVNDELFVCKIIPEFNLRLLDLSSILKEDDIEEFESIDLAIHFLFLAGEHAYPICKDLAKKIFEKGYDGILYPSYFSHVRNGSIPFDTEYGISIRKISKLQEYSNSQIISNLALFGRPLAEKKVKIDCINRVVINRVGYETSFGPALD